MDQPPDTPLPPNTVAIEGGFKPRPADAQAGPLNLADGRDLARLRTMIRDPRWGIGAQFRSDCLKAIQVALNWALQNKDVRMVRAIMGTLAVMEGQNQADQHKLVDVEMARERLQAPAPDISVNVGVQVDRPKPASEESESVRRRILSDPETAEAALLLLRRLRAKPAATPYPSGDGGPTTNGQH